MPRLFMLLAPLFALVFAAGAAQAFEAPRANLQTVEVKGPRTRLVPYRDLFYPMAKAVQQALGGRAALAMQLRPTHQDVRLEDVLVWLEGAHEAMPVARQADGLFVVPVNDRLAEDSGHVLINKKSEDLSINLVLVPTLPREAWTIGAVRRLLDDARRSVGKLLPWYQKPVVWAVTRKLAVSVCSRLRDVPLTLLDGERVVATVRASEELRNYAQETVFCHRFDGEEGYPESTRVVIPEDAEVLLL
jgi:hypothetical protein